MRDALALALLLAACHGDDPIEDVDRAPIRDCGVWLRVEADATSVEVAGAFNDWNPQPLAAGANGWERWLGELRPATYPYKLVVDGAWQDPSPDAYTAWDGGIENLALRVPDCDVPDLIALDGTATAQGTVGATFQWTRAADGASLDVVEASVGGVAIDADYDVETGIVRVEATGRAPGKHSVRVTATDRQGRTATAFLPLWVEPEPFAWQSGSLYYLFVDRFRDGGDGVYGGPIAGTQRGTDYLGGDLVGARQALEEGWFDALGVRSIWLSPVNDNPDDAWLGADGSTWYTGYHGYWPIDATEIEARIGGEEALRAFVTAAHARGIRVVLDLVLNHVHEEHTYLEDRPDWFDTDPCVCTTDPGPCNWDTNPIACWFTDYLPDLDYQHPELVDRVIADTLHQVEDLDVDGFRIDAAKHMDHVIMRTLSLTLRDRYEQAGGAPFYLVGETFTGQGGQGLIMDYVAPWELDGQFDFPLLYPIRRAVGGGEGWRVLADEVRASDAAYGDDVHGMSVFLGNHDVGRYATDIVGCSTWALFEGCEDRLADGPADQIDAAQQALIDRLAMSFAFVLTQPGVPLVYYGDEVGLAGAGDPDNRRLMPWTRTAAQQDLLDRVRTLGTTRTQIEALQVGDRRELWVDDTLYAYARGTADSSAIVLLHRGDTTRAVAIPVPTGVGLEGRTVHDALGSGWRGTVLGGALGGEVTGWQYLVLVPE